MTETILPVFPSGVIIEKLARTGINKTELIRWVFNTIQPFLKGSIIELGSGDGAITDCFLETQIPLHLSDSDFPACRKLVERYDGKAFIKGVHQIDLRHNDFESEYKGLMERFNTVVALNGVGLLFRDKVIFDNAKKLLHPGGNLVIFAPADTALFSRSDDGINIWWENNRRLQKRRLGKAFFIRFTQYIQLMGISGPCRTYLAQDMQSLQIAPLTRYDRVITTFMTAQHELLREIGLSVIIVAKKIDTNSNIVP
jgi:hypothetical protein